MIERFESTGNIVDARVSGKLRTEDYEIFVPWVEEMVAQHGKVRILIDFEDFEGWEAGALWEETKFTFKHFNDIERVAMIGEKRWHEMMTNLCKPFTSAEVKYFESHEKSEARRWIAQ